MIKINENWQIFVKQALDDMNLDFGSLQAQDNLNPDVWEDENSLKKEILERLYDIAKAFMENLSIPRVNIQDVTFTGSLANYTWSKYSDIDLHVIINFSDIDENNDLVRDYLGIAGREWNNKHKITIKGYEV